MCHVVIFPKERTDKIFYPKRSGFSNRLVLTDQEKVMVSLDLELVRWKFGMPRPVCDITV